VDGTVRARSIPLLRYSDRDAILIALSLVYAGLLIAAPSIPLIGAGLWWTANTVAHNFIHTPFFRSRTLNRGYALFLSGVMGVPQSLWRARHLRHHREDHAARSDAGGRAPGPSLWSPDIAVELVVVAAIWIAIAASDPRFFLLVYAPGYAIGLGLCSMQGHFEHARGTTSHYGWLYNWCFFNDGYHAEHHRRPGEHWTRLPSAPRADARASRWPPVLRWLDAISLDALERIVLRSRLLQTFVLAVHERAFAALVPRLPPVRRVTIVGGGLFPRSAIVVHRVLPDAALTIVDARRDHLDIAARFLPRGVVLQERMFDAAVPEDTDLVVIPLAFIGDRERIYRRAPAAAAVVHDWLWHRRGRGARISWLLLKRLNLVTR
jgi:fatty acid desaturase